MSPYTERKRSKHFVTDSQTQGEFYLFTIDENDALTIYKIKSYLAAPNSNKITNFKMAKKTSIMLEYDVKCIEWITTGS